MCESFIFLKIVQSIKVSSFFENIKLANEKQNLIQNRIIVSRSHAGEVKSIIGEKLKNSEVIIAAGSGKNIN